jgi:hypothetical protein
MEHLDAGFKKLDRQLSASTETEARKPLTISELGRTIAALDTSKTDCDRKLVGMAMIYGMPVVVDDKLADGEIRLVLNGKTLAKIINIGEG